MVIDGLLSMNAAWFCLEDLISNGFYLFQCLLLSGSGFIQTITLVRKVENL